jgi:LmbE family N-acetylglucosaminyl deacetylase
MPAGATLTWSRLGRVLDAASTAAWIVAFRAAGRLAVPVRRWESAGGGRVLVVAPHPDDETAGCGGTILLHRAAGDAVTVLHVTEGRTSRALGLAPDEMAKRRQAEATAAMATAGVTRWEWLGLPDGEWSDDALTGPFAALLAEVRPDVLYLPSYVDFHPEHRRVARVIAGSRALAATAAAVRVYQIQVPLTGVLVNLVAPVEHVLAHARRVADCYLTQLESLRAPFRLKRYAGVVHGAGAAAEEFWELSARAYAELHAREPSPEALAGLRGLRRLAMTDPLSFAVGRAVRGAMRSSSTPRS